MQKSGQEERDTDAGLYEVGFHLVSSVTEDAAAADFDAVSKILTTHGATVKASENPTLRTLTYTITKHVGGKNIRFDTAYFGSIIFEVDSEEILKIRGEIEKIENLLRFLIIEIDEEALMPRERRVTGKIDAERFRPEKSETPAAPISEEEIDKKIDQLVAE